MNEKQKDPEYTCKNCGKKFASRPYLKSHIGRCIHRRVLDPGSIIRQIRPDFQVTEADKPRPKTRAIDPELVHR